MKKSSQFGNIQAASGLEAPWYQQQAAIVDEAIQTMPIVSPFYPAVREWFWFSLAGGSWRSGITNTGNRPFGLPLVPLMLSYWRGRTDKTTFCPASADSPRARACGACRFHGSTQQEKLEYWFMNRLVSCYLPMYLRRCKIPLHKVRDWNRELIEKFLIYFSISFFSLSNILFFR